MSQKSLHAKRKTVKAPAKLSRTKRPEGMSLEDWQIGLRREHLKRHVPPQDDKVVAVKTAQSA